ncbi:hypothetical protein EZV62_006558 [Acer yangbiense]|uniref:Pectinesterase catalytic domain-containing protein n=1 Tax=Acer yangbiense TaxID=1000413 RepID=A0A5C7I6V5_9ROSI|nr:hypothetical protein EZV62_006558 [Acer yangbiense]
MVTADGRFDENLNTLIVIHNCSISPTPKLKGNSTVKAYLAVVIQNSYIGVRLPSGGQTVVTADGRFDENLNTIIVIHNCSISPTPKLKGNSTVKAYLGWLKFDSMSDLVSLYYAEYGSIGNGSFTEKRNVILSRDAMYKTNRAISCSISPTPKLKGNSTVRTYLVGEHYENVDVIGVEKRNVILSGDGMYKTNRAISVNIKVGEHYENIDIVGAEKRNVILSRDDMYKTNSAISCHIILYYLAL